MELLDNLILGEPVLYFSGFLPWSFMVFNHTTCGSNHTKWGRLL